MSKYYFLVSSLPFLKPGQEAPMSIEDFLSTAKDHLDPSLLNLVKTAVGQIQNPVTHPLMDSWKTFDKDLRVYLANQRLLNLDFSQEIPPVSGEHTSLSLNLQNLGGGKTPLELERALDVIRWGFLEELEQGFYFELENVLVYALKLKLLQREASFTLEKGKEYFDRDYKQIIAQEKLS